MRLSVVVPIYNASAHIETCLKSAFAGIPSDVEFVLVDDGCTDDSIVTVKRIVVDAGIQNQVKIMHHHSNMGVLVARMTGIKASSGDYITFLDADDRVVPGCYTRMISALDKNSADMLTIGYVENKNGRRQDPFYKYRGSSDKCQRIRDAIIMKTDPYLWTKVVRRSLFSKVKDPVANIAEDWAYTVQLTMHADSFAVIDETLYEYFIYPDSISHAESNDEQIIERAMSEHDNVLFIEDVLEKDGLSETYRNEMEARKYNVKRVLLPVCGSRRSLWMSVFRDINISIIFNRYVPVTYKMKHIAVLLGIYSWLYPLFKRCIG